MAHHQPEELSRLQEYLEKEAGFDPLITHGIVEAISSAEREEAEEIANVYLEGNDKALELVRDYFAVLDASRPGSKAEGTDAAEAAPAAVVAPPPGFSDRTVAQAPPGFSARIGEVEPEVAPPADPKPKDSGTGERSRGGKRRGKKTQLKDLLGDLDYEVSGKICDCQATRHRLVANCLSCGRVVCSQEGEGPCHFCGSMVTKDREVRLAALLERQRGGKKEDKADVVDRAITEKERLLGYDRSAAKQTAIIDDQSDFFEIDGNVWLSQEEKAVLRDREREAEERRNDKRLYVTFDLLGRKIVSADGPDEEEEVVEVEVDAVASIPSNPTIENRARFKSSAE